MTKNEFSYYRKKMGKTQKEMAELIGTSLKAIHSYEQGWRRVPMHAERQILFLYAMRPENDKRMKDCWQINHCLSEQKQKCPAWEFRAGKMCWFINGTICEGTIQRDWREKMKLCKKCEVFAPLSYKGA